MPCPSGINSCSCERALDLTGKMPEECWSAASRKQTNPFVDFFTNHIWATGNWSGTPQTMESSIGALLR